MSKFKYLDKTIDEATQVELLHALMFTEHVQAGPHKTSYNKGLLVCSIGIGNDNTADIRLFKDDYDKLREMVETQ